MDNLVRAAQEIERLYSGEDAGIIASAFLAMRETQRDRFAMAALPMTISEESLPLLDGCHLAGYARAAYAMADAMLEAREEER